MEEDTGGKDNPFGKDYNDHENEIVWHLSPNVADTCMPFFMCMINVS